MKFLLMFALINFGYLSAKADVLMDIHNSVDPTHLQQLLEEMTGTLPVKIGGKTFSLTERYSAPMKANFRNYWKKYFNDLGMQVNELAYDTAHTSVEAQGHNLEAILPGLSKDTFVIIVHYDSMGPDDHETDNPGVDDDMTGMATMLETARILTQYQDRLQYTVRFVAVDFEEWDKPGLEGSRVYASYLQQLAAKEGFQIIGAVDDEQNGWNCAYDGLCDPKIGGHTTYMATCSRDDKTSSDGKYHFDAIGDLFVSVASEFSDIWVDRGCEQDDSDHYAMWEIGVPTVVFSEPYGNPQYDSNGGDVYSRIDQDYFYRMSQLGVVFAAKNVIIN